MGFLSKESGPAQEEYLDDIYTVLKTHKEQDIIGENLQTVLLSIEGVRDSDTIISNDGSNNSRWQTCGVYDENSGLFYIKDGEHSEIQKHFKPLSINRLTNKKVKHNFKHKRVPNEETFHPTINEKTQKIANDRRHSIFGC